MVVSVIISTYNRCKSLGTTIASVLSQAPDAPSFEVIVVNNNSTDDTAVVIKSFAARETRVRYVFERRQGLSHGRNAGLAVARGEFILFTDDDVVVSATWVRDFYDAFLRYPDADFIGGKVLPTWEREPEAWLDATMSPLALQDMGTEPLKVTQENPRCLIGACLGIRQSAFDKAGLFDPTTQRVGDGVGSIEDSDWELKVWRQGGWGVYVPDIVCTTEVPAQRMAKSYHRKWHLGHGKFHALSRRPEFEGSGLRVADVPGFVYRQVFQSGYGYITCLLRGQAKEAFLHQTAVFFYVGFIRQR
jgi:glucosyl-dolichyl phosphate glucuronosyltransferase